MIFVGIDNGADGGIVAIRGNGDPVVVEPAPMLTPGVGKTRGGKVSKKRVPDVTGMIRLLREVVFAAGGASQVFAVLEHAQAFPKESPTGAFNYGRGYGAWEAGLVSLGVAYEIVRPQEWGAILKGIQGTDTKVRALLKVQRALPRVPIVLPRCRVAHPGLVDAACMALFGIAYKRALR